MLRNLHDLLATVRTVYGDEPVPRLFELLRAVAAIEDGRDPRVVAREVRSTAERLARIREAEDPIDQAGGRSLRAAGEESEIGKARRIIGQLLVGKLAEDAFETTYRKVMGTEEIRLEDDRGRRTDTDYRVLNGSGRPVFRINIKFHGTPFRKALDVVGLEPSDCFALATYKIWHALQKQDEEHLSYIFVIIGVPDLTGERVGKLLDEDLVHLAAVARQGKRSLEERIVEHVLGQTHSSIRDHIQQFTDEIGRAEWRVISARKADNLLRELLFDRVIAVRVPRFNMNWRGAEVDMHFSISRDLTPLTDFLQIVKSRGLHGVSNYLERGTI